MKILFFGSTTDSIIVLEKIVSFGVSAIVTQPPRPVGRDKIITPTPVELWAKQHGITTLSFESNQEKPWLFHDEQQVIDTLEPIKADLLISASFGVKIPWQTIEKAPYGGFNIHPSLLPRWRGADPVPWAILSGDHQIGVSVVTLSQEFDKGTILAQKKIPILPTDTSDPLRTKLFEIGADLLIDLLPTYFLTFPNFAHVHNVKKSHASPYARKFKREDGFEPWEKIIDPSASERISQKFRALHPWPGLWTTFYSKRLKILEFMHMPVTVQLEGKKPVSWGQFKKAYLPS